MVRPKCEYKVSFSPPCRKFKPQKLGRGCCVAISLEEAEAMRLKNLELLEQTEAASRMGVSQSTFQRLLASAYKKVTEALIEGKELHIK
jgi:uncharacterized protein